MYRAWESERPDALFHDPYARRLAGPQGETIVRTMPKARTWAWPMVVRTCLFDELILRAIERDGVGTVLNLAAGLDARPWRLPLSPALRWIDVDLPDMIAYKKRQMAGERPRCALEYAAARSEEHTSELQSLRHLVCRLLLEKKKKKPPQKHTTTT